MSERTKETVVRIEKFLSTPNDNIIRTKDTGDGYLVYTELTTIVEELKEILSRFDKEGLEHFPTSQLMEFDKNLDLILSNIENISQSTKDPSKPETAQKNNIIQSAKRNFDKEKDDLWNFIVQTRALHSKESLNKETELDLKIIKETLIESKLAKENIDSLLKDANSVLTSSKEELSKAGISKHKVIFENQANTNARNAKNWFKGLIVILIVTIACIFILYYSVIKDSIEKGNYETIIISAITLSLLTYLISVCAKNYYAEKHNETVNRHKANCLSTYNTFIDSSDEERKQAILLQATQTIFSHQRSGFIGKESEQNSPNPIIEIVRNTSKQ